MSVTINLEKGEAYIKPILICDECGNEVANVGESYSFGTPFPDILLKCKACGKEGKINEDKWRTMILLYERIRLSEQKVKPCEK